MDFPSRITFNSKVVPGAVVTFRRATATNRAAYLESGAKYRAELRAVRHEGKATLEAYDAALKKAKAEAKTRVDALIEAEGITREEAEKREWDAIAFFLGYVAEHPEYAELSENIAELAALADGVPTLRALFVRIEGVTVGGHEPTIDEILTACPDSLIKELMDAAQKIAALDPTERGELLWPTTSPAVEDGPSQSTTAASAESKAEAA